MFDYLQASDKMSKKVGLVYQNTPMTAHTNNKTPNK